MKKTITTLLIVAATSFLGLSQETALAPTLTPIQSLVKRINDSNTQDAVKVLEVEAAGILTSANESDNVAIVNALYRAYSKVYPVSALIPWQINVAAKYTPNWSTSTSGSIVSYYSSWVVFPAQHNLQLALKGVKNVEEFDNTLRTFLSTNLYPERVQNKADSRFYSLVPVVYSAASRSIELSHPEALNYALLYYKLVNMSDSKGLDKAISLVAQAVKGKDTSLTRANAWIAGQNTGVPKVDFSEQEKQLPSALQPLSSAPLVKTSTTISAGKEEFRKAQNATQINKSIYSIATALKSLDLNLARANAWIASQKDGTAFELP